jgi:hypothetical protein
MGVLMGKDGLTITFPELRQYWLADCLLQLSGPLAGVVGLLAISAVAANRDSRGFYMVLVVAAFVLFIGLRIYCSRTTKRLAPLVNERFAAEFMLRTGLEYPQHLQILEIQETIPARNQDGSVSLWSVRQRRDAFHLAPG